MRVYMSTTLRGMRHIGNLFFKSVIVELLYFLLLHYYFTNC